MQQLNDAGHIRFPKPQTAANSPENRASALSRNTGSTSSSVPLFFGVVFAGLTGSNPVSATDAAVHYFISEPATVHFQLAREEPSLAHPYQEPATKLPPEQKWERPCDAMFEALADEAPARLVRLLDSKSLNGAHIASIAEIAGQRLAPDVIVDPLLRVLYTHPRPMAREGALHGLYFHRADHRVVAAIKLASCTDETEEVREAARDILEQIDESALE